MTCHLLNLCSEIKNNLSRLLHAADVFYTLQVCWVIGGGRYWEIGLRKGEYCLIVGHALGALPASAIHEYEGYRVEQSQHPFLCYYHTVLRYYYIVPLLPYRMCIVIASFWAARF